MKLFILLLVLSISVSKAVPSSNERQVIEGYLKNTKGGQIFLLKRPGTLEPGIKVSFESKNFEEISCKLNSFKKPFNCPLQRFSFIPTLENNKAVMTKTRLEGSSNQAWNRVTATEALFDTKDRSK